MSTITPKYDDSLEKQLNALICKLDENPKVTSNPVEKSSYLGFPLAETSKGFLKNIKENYSDKFLVHLDSFKQKCISLKKVNTLFIPTVRRLLKHYEEAGIQIGNSSIRTEWANHFSAIPDEKSTNTNEDGDVSYAYRFFYDASSVQMFFLRMLQDKLKDYLIEFGAGLYAPEEKYFFTILPIDKKHRYNVLRQIHKRLHNEGYINCPLDDFVQVFTSQNPHPIIWKKDYVHLTYLLKEMTGKFLKRKNKPSNNQIARKYFYEKEIGNFFSQSGLRNQEPPNSKDKKFLDYIIKDSVNYYHNIYTKKQPSTPPND